MSVTEPLSLTELWVVFGECNLLSPSHPTDIGKVRRRIRPTRRVFLGRCSRLLDLNCSVCVCVCVSVPFPLRELPCKQSSRLPTDDVCGGKINERYALFV